MYAAIAGEVCARDATPPEIVDRLDDDFVVVGDQLEFERQAGGECSVGEGALAEAVDGEYGCFVEGLQGEVEAVGELLWRMAELLELFDEVGDESVGGR